MVMHFSAAEKDRGMKFLRACSTTIQTGLLSVWWTLAHVVSRRRHYFRDRLYRNCSGQSQLGWWAFGIWGGGV